MRPRNPVACRITIGGPSPPQSSVCKLMPLTFTKVLRGWILSMAEVFCESIVGARVARCQAVVRAARCAPIGFAISSSFMARLVSHGKYLLDGAEKFYLRGVSYGPFAPNSRGERYPEP